MSLSKSTPLSKELCKQNFISVCGICLSIYEVPKALPCLHSFCLACLQEWISHFTSNVDTYSRAVPCPNCRKDCILPATGVEGLPTNFFLTERNRVEEPTKCTSCDRGDGEIVARCIECGFVCNVCMSSHKSMQQNHSVIMLGALRVGKSYEQVNMLRISRVDHEKSFKLQTCINLTSANDLSPFLTNVWCCSVNKSGSSYQIAVPQCSSSGKVFILGIDGKQKLIIDTTEALASGQCSYPWNVAMSSDGHYYITDNNPWVRVHDNKGRFIHLLHLHDVNGLKGAEGWAKGITIDNQGQIIVGNTYKKTVCIYRVDESFVKTLKVDTHPEFITPTTNSLFICAGPGDYVLEVDYSGVVLNRITSPTADMKWQPRGVCCSDNGEIFVVNSAIGHCGVYHLSSSGKYRPTGHVITDLKDPSGIAISEDRELLTVVDCQNELKIYRRV